MATLQEIEAEIARRQRIAEIDRLIAEKQGTTVDAFIEPLQAIGGGLLGQAGAGLSGIVELIQTGDLDAAVNEINRIKQSAQQRFAPQTEAGRAGLENVVGAVQAVEEGIIRPAVAGTAGLAKLALQPSEGIEGAKATVRAVREQGLGKAAGQQVFEETGSPLLATATELMPDIAELAIPARTAQIGTRATAARQTAKTQEAQRALDDLISGDVAKDSTVIDVANTIQKGDADDIAAIINADPEFFRAADELGITTEPLASFASRNSQFRDVEQALATVPGSVLADQSKAFIKNVSEKADNLIEQYGGTLDKAQLGRDFKADSLKTIDDLFQQADDSYSQLRQLIPEQNRFEVTETVSFLESLASKDKLPPKFARVLRQLRPKQKTTKGSVFVDPATGARRDTSTTEAINPTLGRIDLIRREIGQAVNKGTGPFKNVETGLNKALYARLTKDQDLIAQQVGGDALAISDTGKTLVKQRKQIEDNLVALLGEDLNGALNVKVSGAIKNLTKGEIDKFNAVMNAIPKSKRGEVALSAMNDVFKGSGVGQQALNPTQFTKFMQTINRSPATKRALFNALPKESAQAIENLFQVSRGISRALGQKTPTGRINALFNEDTGFIRKMVGRAVPSLVAIATKSPTASVLASSATEQFLRQASDGAKRASDLMASPEFQNIIRKSVKEGVVDGNKASKELLSAEKKLARSKVYQRWAENLSEQDRAALAGGLIGYLFSQDQEQ